MVGDISDIGQPHNVTCGFLLFRLQDFVVVLYPCNIVVGNVTNHNVTKILSLKISQPFGLYVYFLISKSFLFWWKLIYLKYVKTCFITETRCRHLTRHRGPGAHWPTQCRRRLLCMRRLVHVPSTPRYFDIKFPDYV